MMHCRFCCIFWIAASTQASIHQSFLDVARELGLAEAVITVQAWLTSTTLDWLLIFDNADDPAVGLSNYIPTHGKGSILVTSRNPQIRMHATVGSAKVGPIELEAAKTLLMKTAKDTDFRNTVTQASARLIAEYLCYLPLALVQAGAYISQTRCTVEGYLELLKHTHNATLTEGSDVGTRESVISDVFRLPVQRLEEQGTRACHDAVDFLRFSSFVSPKINAEELLERACKNTSIYQRSPRLEEYRLRVLCDPEGNEWQSVRLWEALEMLKSFSLIHVMQDKRNISIHCLVHRLVRDSLSDEEARRYSTITALTLSSAASFDRGTEDYTFREALSSHLDTFLCTYNEAFVTADIGLDTWADSLISFARVFFDVGQVVKALDLEIRAMELHEKSAGIYDASTLRSMNRIGRQLRDIGRPAEAATLDERALKRLQSHHGSKELEIVEATESLANSYSMLGKSAKAAELLLEALKRRQKLHGEAHSGTITAMSQLADCYHEVGRYQEALELWIIALSHRRRHFGDDHPDTLIAMNNLAVTHDKLHHEQEAVELLEAVLQKSTELLGSEHTYSIKSKQNLAASYSKLGRYTLAADLRSDVVDSRLKCLGSNHSDTWQAMSECAKALENPALGRYEEALRLREELVRVIEEHCGTADDRTRTALADLSKTYDILGQHQKAMHLRQALQANRHGGSAEVVEKTRNVVLSSFKVIDTETNFSNDDSEPSEELVAVGSSPTSLHVDIDTQIQSSDDLSDYSEDSILSSASSTSSSTSYDSVAIDAIGRLASTFESDAELCSAYEDSLLVMSRRRFMRKHMQLLKSYFNDIATVTNQQRKTVKFLRGKRRRNLIAEEICNRTSINRIMLRAAKQREETSDDLLKFDRFRVPEHSLVETGSMDLSLSSEDSEDSDIDTTRTQSEISTLEFRGLVDLLTHGEAFHRYKSRLVQIVNEQCSPRVLRSVARLGNVNALGGLIERHFDILAKEEFEWLQELQSLGYKYLEIAELLVDDTTESPWIYFNQPEPLPGSVLSNSHIPDCVHHGINEASVGTRLNPAKLENAEETKRLITEHCGLAGVVPKSREPKGWTGLVTFSGEDLSTASITYNKSDSHYELLLRVREVVQRFCGVTGFLQKERLCCNSFTMLRYNSIDGYDVVELCRMKFPLASELLVVLQMLVSNFRSPAFTSKCLRHLRTISRAIIGTVCDISEFDENIEPDFDGCFNDVSLAAQVLTLGLFLYSQAHTGVVHPFSLMKPLSHIHLYGTRSPRQHSTGAHIQVCLFRLTCMAGVTGDLVAVVQSFYRSEPPSTEQAYDLLASPEDLADTWDVWNFVMDAAWPFGDMIYGIDVGGGLVSSIGEVDSISSPKGIPRLHWSRGSHSTASKAPFHLRSKALIGTTRVNRLCPMDEHQSWLNAHVAMETLGAENSYWEQSEAQAGLQGGQFVIAQLNMTWVKRPGITLKHIHLRPDINLPFLQSDWGLQISYCTGVARRVPLCNLIADVISDLIEPLFQKPGGWKSLQAEHDIVSALRGPIFKAWFEILDKDLQNDVSRILRYILLVLQDTGVDRSGENLVAIWPHRSDPLRCFKIPCRKATSWAQMLADSPDCATFAYITPLCLETDECQCQDQPIPLWHNKSVVLSTAVSRHVKSNVVTAAPWALRHEQSYLIGPAEHCLLGRVVLPLSPATMHNLPSLHILPNRFPKTLQPRIIERFKERIREKQCNDARAQGVMVSAGHGGWFL